MKSHEKLFWIGVRESEIKHTGDLFEGSITTYGTNKNSNHSFDKFTGCRIDCNADNKDWITYINDTAREIINEYPDCKFLLYYPPDYPLLSCEIQERVVGLNKMELILLLENKIRTRLWLHGIVNQLPFCVMDGSKITIESLTKKYPQYNSFVVQSDSSCAGNGTWLFNSFTAPTVQKRLSQTKTYTVSPYIENNIPLNIHLVIYQNEILYLPPSIQLISPTINGFFYKGGDFIAYEQISEKIKEKIIVQAELIGKRLQESGYRGVCGIDFIATEDEVYFMEINSRFQASTMAINYALHSNTDSHSIQELHYKSFFQTESNIDLSALKVNLSFYTYSHTNAQLNKHKYLYNILPFYKGIVRCIDDDIDWESRLENKSYLFQLCFPFNIVSVSPEYKCLLHPNVAVEEDFFDTEQWRKDLEKFKISLLHHGVRISPEAKLYAELNGGLNYYEFEAFDLIVDDIYINVPNGTKPTFLTPFEIGLSENKEYTLRFYDKIISKITLRKQDPLSLKKSINGFSYGEISYLGNDRLRVYFRNSCYFKQKNLGCKFCDIENSEQQFTIEDIAEVLHAYKNQPSINHYLVGGGSYDPYNNFEKVIEVVNLIRQQSQKPIYLMCTPPHKSKILDKLFESGVTEVSFNLEVFDRILAQKYMPGKGALSLETYKTAFEKAVRLWGKNGKVRTIFIVGLEPKESFLKGVEFVCQLGVSPILSLFKPIAGTPLETLFTPSDSEIYDMLTKAKEICRKYNVPLGPTCHFCEDNTLKITL